MSALYTDDIFLIYSDRIILRATAPLQSLLRFPERLKINESKSVSISKRKRHPLEISINDRTVAWKISVKYLGAITNRRLSWCKQRQNARSRTLRVYSNIKLTRLSPLNNHHLRYPHLLEWDDNHSLINSSTTISKMTFRLLPFFFSSFEVFSPV